MAHETASRTTGSSTAGCAVLLGSSTMLNDIWWNASALVTTASTPGSSFTVSYNPGVPIVVPSISPLIRACVTASSD